MIMAPGWREQRILHVDKLRRLEALNGLEQSELGEPVSEMTPQPADSRITVLLPDSTTQRESRSRTRRCHLLMSVGPEDVSSRHGACILAR